MTADFQNRHSNYVQEGSMNDGVLRDRAPGLTADLIDGLLKDAWVEGYWAGMNQGSAEGQAAGQNDGYARATYDLSGRVQDIVNRQLNWSARKLKERLNRDKKTIAAEREFAASVAVELERAIRDLEAITGGPRR